MTAIRIQIAQLIRNIPDLVTYPYIAPGGVRTMGVRSQSEMADVIAEVLYAALYLRGEHMSQSRTDMVTTATTPMRDQLLEMLTDNRISIATEHALEVIAQLQSRAEDMPTDTMGDEDPALAPLMRTVWETAYRTALLDFIATMWQTGTD